MPLESPKDPRNAQNSGAIKLTTKKQEAVEQNERVVGPNQREKLIRERISKRLQEVLQNINEKTKGPLYQGLEGSIKKGEKMVSKLVEMGCCVEVAIDLTVLTLFDVAILIGMFWC